jgi:cytochrome P450
MQRAFTPRAISKMREVVEAIVTRQLDKWEQKTQIDVIDDFAYPLPASVIATMIGAPLEDVHLFHVWADTLTNLLHGGVGASDRLRPLRATTDRSSRRHDELADGSAGRRPVDPQRGRDLFMHAAARRRP